jgi:hypothetical protein
MRNLQSKNEICPAVTAELLRDFYGDLREGKFFKRGQSTLEILIVIAVLAASLMGAVLAFWGSQSLSVDSEEGVKALRLARAGLESAEAQARDNFANITSTTTVYNEFTEELSVTAVDADTKKITSRVTWRTDPLRLQKVELNAFVTDWYNYQYTGGDTGGGGLTGNWLNPKTLGSVDLRAGESATDLDVINKIVYMTATASDPKKDDFFIVDATNGANPAILSSLGTGPGLNAIDAISGYAFVANNSTTAQLQVIDTSDLHNPRLVASFTLPGVSGAGAFGNAIFYADNKIYMGTEKAAGPEFHIIDVSNPLNPVSLGSKELGMEVNAIYVKGNLAYIAVHDDPRLRIYDVSNPQNIIQVGSFSTNAQEPASLWLTGATAYLGSEQGAKDEVFILNVASTTSIQKLGSFGVTGDVNDIRVSGNLAFLATSDTNAEFQVWDISNPASPALIANFNFPNIADGIDYENNLVYVAVRSNDALRIITSQ